MVRNELELHGHGLTDKPEIVVMSKAELPGSEEARAQLEQELGREVLAVSAVTGQGLSKLVGAVTARRAEVAAEATP